jgi:hypothetical protein
MLAQKPKQMSKRGVYSGAASNCAVALGSHHEDGSCGRELFCLIWLCSTRGLPCHFCRQKRGKLLPHRFTLTTRIMLLYLQSKHRSGLWRFVFCCAIHRLGASLGACPCGQALSEAVRRLAVSQRDALWSSDFPQKPLCSLFPRRFADSATTCVPC